MRRIPALIGVAAVCGALYWIWKAPERGSGDRDLHTPAAAEDTAPANLQSSASDPTPPAEESAPSRRTPKDPRLAGYNDFSGLPDPPDPEEVKEYLRLKGRTPETLATAFYLCADWDLLDELKDYSGDSPVVLATLAGQIRSDEDRLRFANRMIETAPDNAYGYLLKFAAETATGRSTESMRTLERIGDLHALDSYWSETDIMRREAWRLLGRDAVEAQVRSEQSVATSGGGRIFIAKTIQETMRTLANADDPDAMFATITPLLNIATLYRGDSDAFRRASFQSVLDAQVAEVEILKWLPPDTEYGDSGMTVNDRYEEMKRELREAKGVFEGVTDALYEADPLTVEQYFERLDTLGRDAANRWILESSGKE